MYEDMREEQKKWYGRDGVETVEKREIKRRMILLIFFFKQKAAYEMLRSLVGSEICIRDILNMIGACQMRIRRKC